MPYLTGNGWSSLQGMNASAPLTLHLNPFITDPAAAADSFVFFTVYDYNTSQFVVDDGFLPPSTTDVMLAANQLAAGHLFAYEVIYSSRVFVPSPGANFDAQIGFELRTQGTFATAVPEPANAALLLAGLGAIGVVLARRRPAG
jgi:hypothetical protein